MSQQPPVLSPVGPERLTQIARRKLAELNVAAELAQDGQTLEGELPFPEGTVLYPGRNLPMDFARFRVEGYNGLRFLDPPLSALPPIQFFNAESTTQLEERVAQMLRNRLEALAPVAEAMRGWGLDPALEPSALVMRAVLQTERVAYELLGLPGQIRVSRVLPKGGTPEVVGQSLALLDPKQLPTREALEQHLTAWRESRHGSPPASPKPSGTPAIELTAVPPAAEALTLGALVQKFGDAALSPATQIELIQQFEVRGERYQFLAVQEVGTVFAARLLGPLGDEWEGSFDLQQFSGIQPLLTSVFTRKHGQQVAVQPHGAPAPKEVDASSGLPRPAVGQFWVMSVVVEQEVGDEVRYVGLNAHGQPYGAARILKKEFFESTFFLSRGSWKLMIRIERVEGNEVYYVQVDSQRQPRGQWRKVDLAALVSSFLPES
ncbi:MAG: hypothetical protein ACOZIN_11275 [Myxococcota bacterium]